MSFNQIFKDQKKWREKFSHNITLLSPEQKQECKQIEELEWGYLSRYYHFMKFAEKDMLSGFATKEKIREDWLPKWGNGEGTSDFAVGAERIVYALLNGKGIGTPNSAPVGSDLMFELNDAMIHIDMKTVKYDPTITRNKKGEEGEWNNNIGDFKESIFVGNNQNSYDMTFTTKTGRTESYSPNLPHYYTITQDNQKLKKLCLSYFVTILYDAQNNSLDTICIMLSCMPNGALGCIYKEAPLVAGKNPGKARFKFPMIPYFEMLNEDNKKYPRTKVIYLNEGKLKEDDNLKKHIEYIHHLYNTPENML